MLVDVEKEVTVYLSGLDKVVYTNSAAPHLTLSE